MNDETKRFLEEEAREAEEQLKREKHTHRHDIPVEWESDYKDVITAEFNQPYDRHRVTKLRCACGDEVERT